MAKDYQIDGTTITYVNRSDWIERVEATSLNVETVVNRFQTHRWQSDAMLMSEWETVVDLAGTFVDLTTNDPDDRNNDYVTYYGARVDSVTGRHVSRYVANVTIDFLVRV